MARPPLCGHRGGGCAALLCFHPLGARLGSLFAHAVHRVRALHHVHPEHVRNSSRFQVFGVSRRPVRIRPLRRKGIFHLRSSIFGLRSSIFDLRSSVFGLRSSIVGPQRLRRRFRRETIAEHRQRAGLFGGKAEHARRVAHGAPPTPGDVLADHRGVFAAVAFVHILQDALAVAVGEIDVDVGGFLALFT